MQFKYTKEYDYSEIGQHNPLRFIVLSKEGDFYTNDTGWFRCKDFFNDLVFTRQTGNAIRIYGFDTKFAVGMDNTQPLLVGLKKLTQTFQYNVMALNWFLSETKRPIIRFAESCTPMEAVIEIPPYYLENTYRISLLTLLLRCLNVERINNWTEFLLYPHNYQDKAMLDQVIKKNIWFKARKLIKTHVWHSSPQYNSNMGEVYGVDHMIHSNGVISWMENL